MRTARLPRLLLAPSVAVAVACWSPEAPAQVFEPSRFLPLAVTVLRVEAPSIAGDLKVGTAITVAPGVVVTNCHVTRDAVSVRVAKRAGRWPANGQYADAEHDLCFLSVPTWPGRPIRFANPGSPSLYQPVVAMGFTGGADVSVTPGEVTGLHEFDGGRIIQSTTSFSSGASGGALLDVDGGLVGVLTFRLRGKSNHYFSVPASWVAARLPIAASQFRPIGSVAGRAFWEADACCLPYFMRVGALQAQGRWPELLRLADEWVAADPSDADAWVLRGLANARLGRTKDAAAALDHALAMAPRNAEAWFEWGSASIGNGDADAARRAITALTGLESELARKLSEKMTQAGLSAEGPAGCSDCAGPR